MFNLTYSKRNAQKTAIKFHFSPMKLVKIKRLNHTLLAKERKKAYIAERSINLYHVQGGQFSNTLTQKFLSITAHLEVLEQQL